MKNREDISFSVAENKYRVALRDFLASADAQKIEQEINEQDYYPREFYGKLGNAGFLAQV